MQGCALVSSFFDETAPYKVVPLLSRAEKRDKILVRYKTVETDNYPSPFNFYDKQYLNEIQSIF